MPSAEERFRAKVVRRRGHQVWTGSIDHRGVGMVRMDGKLRTVQRAAWEFAYGPLPHGARVNTCAGERACVRVEHLSVSPSALATQPPMTGARRAKGAGSIREIRPGVWEVTITDGKQPDGRPRRRSTTVTGDRATAERAVATLAASVRRDLGDLRVRELVGRWLHEQRTSRHAAGFERDRCLLHEVIEPAMGDTLAADLSGEDVERALRPVYLALGADRTRDALGLVRDAYRWATQQRWCNENPTTGITIRTLM